MRKSARRLRIWHAVHKWTSLICTVFLLVICLSGLPLIFAHEIDEWLDDDPPYRQLPDDTPRPSLDHLVAQGRALFPGQIVTSTFVDDDEPQVIVSMAPSWEATKLDPDSSHFIKFDARTAEVLDQSKPPDQRQLTFMGIMLRLHMDLFAGLSGNLFMAFMGLMFLSAIISGMILYGPFARKVDFGEVRRRSRRLRWLDLHNLLGVVTVAWGLVVGATGVMNELSLPLFRLWQRTDVQTVLRPHLGKPSPRPHELSSVQTAFDTSKRALPGMVATSAIFPGSEFGTPYHYLIWMKGASPLTSRLFSPVLVDARTGALTAVVKMPWYLRALEVSRPLHFGDYGGLPFKIIWALLDLVTIAVLGSGLYLWIDHRHVPADVRWPQAIR